MEGEHWLGLESIYNLGRQEDYKLLLELEDWMNKKVYAAYSSFHLEPESQSYRLRLGTYQGNAGDSLASHNGKQFTTLDHDRDAFSGVQSYHFGLLYSGQRTTLGPGFFHCFVRSNVRPK